MGNRCAGCIFFTCIDPLSKGTSYTKTYSVRQTKRVIHRSIRSAKYDKVKNTWTEFSTQSYPEEVIEEAAEYFRNKGYTIIATKPRECVIRLDIMLNKN